MAEIAARYPQRDPKDFSKARPPVAVCELFDLALANMSELGWHKADLRLLKRIEKDLIKCLSDYRKPLPRERAAWLYNRCRRWEEHFAGTDGQADRLERLHREYDNYLRRRAVDAAVKQVAIARAAAATERDSPWEAVAPPARPFRDQITPQNNRSDGGSATPVAVETPQDACSADARFPRPSSVPGSMPALLAGANACVGSCLDQSAGHQVRLLGLT
jgi:hypothetical protein